MEPDVNFNRCAAAVAAVLSVCAILSFGDDAAGLMRVETDQDGVAAFALPFVPFGDGVPGTFLSGPFAEGDVLHMVKGDTGSLTNAVFASGGWAVPSGASAPVSAPGDAFVLAGGAASAPFAFFVYGRVPSAPSLETVLRPGANLVSYGYPALALPTNALPVGVTGPYGWDAATTGVSSAGCVPWTTPFVVTNSAQDPVAWSRPRPYPAPEAGPPAVSGVAVDPSGAFADVSVLTGGRSTDLFAMSSDGGIADGAPWTHLVRVSGEAESFTWRDLSVPDGACGAGASFYVSADATRDADGDGLPDAAERLVHGTSPAVSDTDGDGIADGLEVAWGMDPLVPDAGAPFAFFEPFEPPAVAHGGIAGQNGWTVSGSGSAKAQGLSVSSGSGALRICAEDVDDGVGVEAAHAVPAASDVVWLDFRQTATRNPGAIRSLTNALVAVTFGDGGHPVLTDGGGLCTNLSVSVPDEDRWVRCTCMLDFSARRWDFYLDGVIAAGGLSLRGSAASLGEVAFGGGAGALDDLRVSSTRPDGLSSDGDPLPDEWEFVHFGTLDRDGSGDADSDGLSDLDEFRHGGDPLVADTDGDGMPDMWEVAHGLDPADPSDASADPDGDGIPNLLEHAYGYDPHAPETPPPAGYVPGLDVAYHAFEGSLRTMPDLSNSVPVSSSVARQVSQERTLGAWPGAPEWLVDRFAAVFSGVLLVPTSGVWRISLSTDDGGRLWLDGRLLIDHPEAHSWASRTADAALSAGVHALRVECYDDLRLAGVQLSWALEGGQPVTVPEHSLFRPSGAPLDSDGDGIPDWWEAAHGLDPSDPADAALDPDGDGLSSLAEYHAGSDPSLADTDGDGMPDGWEAAHGACPFLDDALSDPDGDGLANIEEYAAGTAPDLADTDGDGQSDFNERNVFLSDPLAVDFDGTFMVEQTLVASNADAAVGSWYVLDGAVCLAGRSGSVVYADDISLGSAGPRQIRLDAAFSGPYDTELVCMVDGVRVGEALLPASTVPSTNAVAFNTRWLQPGAHSLSLELQNFANGASFSFGDISVGRPGGPDADGNGVPDWIDSRLRNSCVDRGESIASKVSPFCLKGRSAMPPEVFAPSGACAVGELPMRGWWADVPLSAVGGTDVDVVYEGGMKTGAVHVAWTPFDALLEGDVVVRRGDSLLLTAGGGAGDVLVDGVRVAFAGTAPVPFRFDEYGGHGVVGACGGATNTLTVTVVSCGAVDEIPVWRGKVNAFGFSGNGFPLMSAAWDGGAELVSLDAGPCECRWTLRVSAFGHPRAIAFTLPNPDASIVRSVPLRPFAAYYTLEGAYHAIGWLDDGTAIVENRLSAFDVPPSLTLRMSGMSGVCYPDGTGHLELSAGSFSPEGDCLYRFLVPAGLATPCQVLRAYFDGKELAR